MSAENFTIRVLEQFDFYLNTMSVVFVWVFFKHFAYICDTKAGIAAFVSLQCRLC